MNNKRKIGCQSAWVYCNSCVMECFRRLLRTWYCLLFVPYIPGKSVQILVWPSPAQPYQPLHAITMATELHRQTCRIFLPKPYHPNPTTAVLHPVADTHIWCQGSEQANNKGCSLLSWHYTEKDRQLSAYSHFNKAWGCSDLHHSLSWAPVLHVSRVLPHAKVKRYISYFMVRIKNSFSPPAFLSTTTPPALNYSTQHHPGSH